MLTWFKYLDKHRGLLSFLVTDSDIRGMLKCEEDSGRASAVQDLARDHRARYRRKGLSTGRPDPCRRISL